MEYQNLVKCSRRTAARDLDELLAKGILQRLGAGRNAYYIPAVNRAVNLPIMPMTRKLGLSGPFGIPN
jgi:predicted HTH transcriptional regulator